MSLLCTDVTLEEYITYKAHHLDDGPIETHPARNAARLVCKLLHSLIKPSETHE